MINIQPSLNPTPNPYAMSKFESPGTYIDQNFLAPHSYALRKVKLQLTWSQLAFLALVCSEYFRNGGRRSGIAELATLYGAYKISEKLRLRVIRGRAYQIVNLTLNMAEAFTIYQILTGTDFADFAIYEANISSMIIGEIDKQTI